MPNDARLAHQGFQILVSHGADLAGFEAVEYLLKGWPFPLYHGVLETGTEYS